MRQFREVRIPAKLAMFVEGAEGKQRRRLALLDDLRGVAEVGGCCLVVDLGLAALERHQTLAAAREAEDRLHVEAKQAEGQHRREIKRRRALTGIVQLDALQLAEVLQPGDAQLGGDVGRAAGWPSEEEPQLAVVIFDVLLAKQIGELGGARGVQHGQAVWLGGRRVEIGAGDRAAARHVLDDDVWLAGQIFREEWRDEATPQIAAAANAERAKNGDGLIGEIHRRAGPGRG